MDYNSVGNDHYVIDNIVFYLKVVEVINHLYVYYFTAIIKLNTDYSIFYYVLDSVKVKKSDLNDFQIDFKAIMQENYHGMVSNLYASSYTIFVNFIHVEITFYSLDAMISIL